MIMHFKLKKKFAVLVALLGRGETFKDDLFLDIDKIEWMGWNGGSRPGGQIRVGESAIHLEDDDFRSVLDVLWEEGHIVGAPMVPPTFVPAADAEPLCPAHRGALPCIYCEAKEPPPVPHTDGGVS